MKRPREKVFVIFEEKRPSKKASQRVESKVASEASRSSGRDHHSHRSREQHDTKSTASSDLLRNYIHVGEMSSKSTTKRDSATSSATTNNVNHKRQATSNSRPPNGRQPTNMWSTNVTEGSYVDTPESWNRHHHHYHRRHHNHNHHHDRHASGRPPAPPRESSSKYAAGGGHHTNYHNRQHYYEVGGPAVTGGSTNSNWTSSSSSSSEENAPSPPIKRNGKSLTITLCFEVPTCPHVYGCSGESSSNILSQPPTPPLLSYPQTGQMSSVKFSQQSQQVPQPQPQPPPPPPQPPQSVYEHLNSYAGYQNYQNNEQCYQQSYQQPYQQQIWPQQLEQLQMQQQQQQQQQNSLGSYGAPMQYVTNNFSSPQFVNANPNNNISSYGANNYNSASAFTNATNYDNNLNSYGVNYNAAAAPAPQYLTVSKMFNNANYNNYPMVYSNNVSPPPPQQSSPIGTYNYFSTLDQLKANNTQANPYNSSSYYFVPPTPSPPPYDFTSNLRSSMNDYNPISNTYEQLNGTFNVPFGTGPNFINALVGRHVYNNYDNIAQLLGLDINQQQLPDASTSTMSQQQQQQPTTQSLQNYLCLYFPQAYDQNNRGGGNNPTTQPPPFINPYPRLPTGSSSRRHYRRSIMRNYKSY